MAGFLEEMGQDTADFLFGGAAHPPSYQAPNIDKLNQQLSGISAEAQKSPEDLQKEIMQGTESYSGFLPQADRIREQEANLGMGTGGGTGAALAARGQRMYSRELAQMNRAMPERTAGLQMERLAQAQKLIAAREQWRLDVAGDQIKSVLNERAARGQIIGDIIGTAGAIIGAQAGAEGARRGAKAGDAFDRGTVDQRESYSGGSTDYGYYQAGQ